MHIGVTSSEKVNSDETVKQYKSINESQEFEWAHLSKALTRPNSFLLLRQLINTWVLFLTDWVKTDKGPVLNSSCSFCASSSGVISLFGFCANDLEKKNISIIFCQLNLTKSPEQIYHNFHWLCLLGSKLYDVYFIFSKS